MKKQTLRLIMIGTLIGTIPFFAKTVFGVHDDIYDFIRGLGVAVTISALFVQKKLERQNS